MSEIIEIKYVKEFKKLITNFIAKQNAHKIDCISIGADVDENIENIIYLYLNQQLLEINYNGIIYQMKINQNNKQGIYRNLKRFICLVPLYFHTKYKKDGPYTYYRYEKKLKLIRELLDC